MYFQMVTVGLCPFRLQLTVCRTAEHIHIRPLEELWRFFLRLETNLCYSNPDKITVILERCHQWQTQDPVLARASGVFHMQQGFSHILHPASPVNPSSSQVSPPRSSHTSAPIHLQHTRHRILMFPSVVTQEEICTTPNSTLYTSANEPVY